MANPHHHPIQYPIKWQGVPIPLSYWAVMIMAVILSLGLSYWQWQRALSAQHRYQLYLEQIALPVQPLSEVNQHDYRRVIIRGEVKRLFYLDNQIYQGQPGWHVLAIIATAQQPILVNLGWQAKQVGTHQIPSISGDLEVTGLIKHVESGFMLQKAQSDPDWPQIMQQIDLKLLSQYLGYPLSSYVLYADSSIFGLIPVSLHVQNKFYMHIGYVIQWLLIAASAVICFVYVCRKEQKQNENH